ncbi:MAG: T9SS type A sorting domain-containing protein [Saprospiraceae bacterium]|nr:T9SS type A sorting domain-containing protein [Saprospiraceae bacterium]
MGQKRSVLFDLDNACIAFHAKSGFFHLLTYTPSSCSNNTATREVFADPGCGPISAAGTDNDGREYWTLSANQTVRVCITRQSTGGCSSVSSPCMRPYVANVTPAPVSLSSFGFSKNELSHLYWTTQSESNNLGFEIESSNDELQFDKIGFVEGKGNSSGIVNYSFVDKNANNGITYYRLRQVDTDGKFSFSEIITIKHEKSSSLLVQPNLVRDQLRLLVSSDEATDYYDIEIFDFTGRIATSKVNIRPGEWNTLDVSHFKSGLYFVRAHSINGLSFMEKWIKY